LDRLFEKAKKVLTNNWQGRYTIPAAGIYPFQWNWDSGFIAIGWAHFDITKAVKEIDSLFNAQWTNGFLPHIVFWDEASDKAYFPGSDFYRTHLSSHSINAHGTSGITQPPVHAFILEKLLAITNKDEQVVGLIKKLFNPLFQYHRYLYKERDPLREGLVYILHNWESGTDNSPAWDGIFSKMDQFVPNYDIQKLRKDTLHVNEKQRPKNREYDFYLYLVEVIKNSKYRTEPIFKKSPFLVQDPLFNALLIRSNESLIKLAELAGESGKIEQIEAWQEKAVQSLNDKLYDEKMGTYLYFDLKSNKKIDKITSSGFAPLLTSAPDAVKVKRLTATMNGKKFKGENGRYFLCPSFDTTAEAFESQRYWRGPVWLNMNWLLYQGLQRHGCPKLAEEIKKDSLQIVGEQGFYEYFEPEKEKSKWMDGKGYGGATFSWTAALVIDFLKSERGGE